MQELKLARIEEERRQKEIEEEERRQKQINLYLLLKNLEAVNKNIKNLRENIHQIFNSLRDLLPVNHDINKIKEEIIQKVSKQINEYLESGDNTEIINQKSLK